MPPDAAHLPERFGLFTLILLGESVIAVMHGMKSQPGWSVAAAALAFAGMAGAFAVWWWYFERADSTAHQHVRCRADAVRFQVWGYAHLPLYLGIAVAGIGIERSLHHGGTRHLEGAETTILLAAIALVAAALAAIGSVGGRNIAPPHAHATDQVPD